MSTGLRRRQLGPPVAIRKRIRFLIVEFNCLKTLEDGERARRDPIFKVQVAEHRVAARPFGYGGSLHTGNTNVPNFLAFFEWAGRCISSPGMLKKK